MLDPDRTAIRRRLALGVGVLVLLAVLATLFLAGRRTPEPAPAQTPGLDVTPSPLSLPKPPLDRGALIEAAGRAASAYAAGAPAPQANRELVGQRFRIGMPFGCSGPADAASHPFAYWTQDGRGKAVRLVAKPESWADAEWVEPLAGAQKYEAIEGFWLQRPWTGSQGCAPGLQAGPGEQTLALAMFFTPDSSRLLQRSGRPYEHVLNVSDDQAVAPKGYRLMLSGRIMEFEDGQPIRCQASGPNVRPVCIVAVAFETVAFEDPVSGATLAEWRGN